jgi:hypothetical protein
VDQLNRGSQFALSPGGVWVTDHSEYPDDGSKSKWQFALRLVYGIDLLFEKLNTATLSDSERARFEKALAGLNDHAFAFYREHGNQKHVPIIANLIAKHVYTKEKTLLSQLQQPQARDKTRAIAAGAIMTLSKDDLAHGERQVELMLAARAEMVRYVKRGDAVWKWTVRQFAGEAIGSRIYWHSDFPLNEDCAADHTRPSYGEPGYIRVFPYDDGALVDGERLWFAAVYELFNIRGTPQFDRIQNEAQAGLLTRAEYVRRNTMLEFKADLLTRDFYRTVWLPHAVKEKVPCDGSAWGIGDPSTFDSWLAQQDHFFDYWGRYYDRFGYVCDRKVAGMKPSQPTKHAVGDH